MAMQQVGIEFITKGEKNLISALAKADQGQQKLERSARSLESALKRQVASQEAIITTYLALEKAGMEYSAVMKGIEQNTKMLGQAHQAHINGLLRVDTATKSAKDSASVFSAQLKQEEAAIKRTTIERQRAKQSYDQLLASINPTIAAQQRNARVAKTVRDAVRSGTISRREAIETIRQYKAAQDAMNATQSAAGSRYTPQLRRQTSQLGVVFQQAGYQVGDFAVQVQSGTNYMVALGQQLTQLVGVGAMLSKSTKWIAAFSLLGVIVPISTAIIGAFMRANEGAQDAKTSIESLSDAVSAYKDAADEAAKSTKDLSEMYGDSADEARELFEINKTLAELDAIDALKESLISLRDEFGDFSNASVSSLEETMNTFDDLGTRINQAGKLSDEEFGRANRALKVYRDTVFDLETKLGSTTEEAFQFAIELSKLSQADGPREAAEQLDVVRSLYGQIIGGTENATTAQRELLRQLVNTALEALNLKVNIEEASGDLSTATSNASSLANEMSRAASEALRFIANLGSGAGLAAAQARVAGLRAELGARQGGAGDVAAAEARARAQAMADPRTQAALQGPVGLRNETLSRIETEVETARLGAIAGQISSQISALGQDTGGSSGAGTGAAGPNIAEEFERLKRSIDDAYEASQKFKESKDVLDRAMASGVIKTTEEYNRLLGLLREEYDLTSEKGDTFADNMMKIAQTARDALGDAFMSIVDGTKSAKDAFSDMARIILKQAFELLVIKPILDGIFGGLTGGGGGGNFLTRLFGFSNGGAFSGGNVIPFANGGVVSGPTLFPMRGAQTGLMGEAGPEAIMPLKRGKGGKLGVVAEGSSQPVVINQSFNFQANGDDSVKRIIAQEAPKIANLTQKQVLEARSRGGAFRTTFGA